MVIFTTSKTPQHVVFFTTYAFLSGLWVLLVLKCPPLHNTYSCHDYDDYILSVRRNEDVTLIQNPG